MEDRTEYLSASDIAAKLNVSSRSVRRWITDGLLPGARFGRQYRVRESDLEYFVAAKRSETTSLRAEEQSVDGWSALSMDSFADDWDNPLDADYDDWVTSYAAEIARVDAVATSDEKVAGSSKDVGSDVQTPDGDIAPTRNSGSA